MARLYLEVGTCFSTVYIRTVPGIGSPAVRWDKFVRLLQVLEQDGIRGLPPGSDGGGCGADTTEGSASNCEHERDP